MDIIDTLFRLCSLDGVSGDEARAAETAVDMLKNYTDDCGADRFGNVFARIGSFDGDKPTLLLDAHIDRVGLIVNYITEDGFIKASPCGGADRRVLSAQTVTVCGREKIKGVVSVFPPHAGDKKVKDIVIDTGYTKQQLEKYVSLGDRITIDSEPRELIDGTVTAPAIDDRAGVAAILYALELIKGKDTAYNIFVSFSVQEETTEAGAAIAAYASSADLALEVDVSFARTPDSKPEECGEAGKGVMIGIAPSLSRALSDRLIDLAQKGEIPYQLEVMNGRSGTNADKISVTKGGIPCCTLSIPIKYMHTPTEVVRIEDISSTARLIAEFALNGKGE